MDNKIQFSKWIISICVLLAVIGLIAAPALAIIFHVAEGISVALIAAVGAILATSIVFYFKKTQAENTIKIYLHAYEELMRMKREDGDNDIEDTYNEDTISLKIWRGAVNQIPETLTGIGILGTFIGLIIGVGSIGFSSVTAAITSLQTMINGIEIAFYTSIVGIILSICFNLTYKFYWNILLRDLGLFIDDFHKNVIPSEETQMKELQVKYYSTMLAHMPEAPRA